jgi:hypothetical protein
VQNLLSSNVDVSSTNYCTTCLPYVYMKKKVQSPSYIKRIISGKTILLWSFQIIFHCVSSVIFLQILHVLVSVNKTIWYHEACANGKCGRYMKQVVHSCLCITAMVPLCTIVPRCLAKNVYTCEQKKKGSHSFCVIELWMLLSSPLERSTMHTQKDSCKCSPATGLV